MYSIYILGIIFHNNEFMRGVMPRGIGVSRVFASSSVAHLQLEILREINSQYNILSSPHQL